MLDLILRPAKERLLAPAARAVGNSMSPLAVTLTAFVAGAAAALSAARGAYHLALVLWLLNRALDGFDGTLARTQGRQTDAGGLLDIVLDFVVYAAIPIALVVAQPSRPTAIAALLLLGSFYVNSASWMYLAAVLERRDAGARARGELTSIVMPSGLVEGTETILFYSLFLLLPNRLVPLFAVMSVLVMLTVIQRMAWALRVL